MTNIIITYYEFENFQFAYTLINPNDSVKITVGIFKNLKDLTTHAKELSDKINLKAVSFQQGVLNTNIDVIAFL